MNYIEWTRFNHTTDLSEIAKLEEHIQKIHEALPNFREVLIHNDYISFVNVLDEYVQEMNFIINYHDIGKLYCEFAHAFESCKIIKRENLLSNGMFNEVTKEDILNIIENHTLLGGVFTGEYSISILENLIKEFSDTTIKLFIMFSALDVAGYVDDLDYVFRVFKNYIKIISSIKNRKEYFVDYHLKWRLGCLLACYKKIDYDDEENIEKYINELEKNYEKIFSKKIRSVEYFSFFSQINLHYAMWLFGGLSYCRNEDYQCASLDNINICKGFYQLLEDIREHTDGKWDIYFQGYRTSQELAEHVFEKIRLNGIEEIFIKKINSESKITTYFVGSEKVIYCEY